MMCFFMYCLLRVLLVLHVSDSICFLKAGTAKKVPQ